MTVISREVGCWPSVKTDVYKVVYIVICFSRASPLRSL